VKPRMPLQPGLHSGVLVRGVVVRDQVQLQRGRCLLVNELEELDPLEVLPIFKTKNRLL
jgi:hypothetical protein